MLKSITIHNGWPRLIFQELKKNCPKNYYVDKWQLVIGCLLVAKEWLVVANVIHWSKDGSVYVDHIFHPWEMC